jgi:hypothetical protein
LRWRQASGFSKRRQDISKLFQGNSKLFQGKSKEIPRKIKIFLWRFLAISKAYIAKKGFLPSFKRSPRRPVESARRAPPAQRRKLPEE